MEQTFWGELHIWDFDFVIPHIWGFRYVGHPINRTSFQQLEALIHSFTRVIHRETVMSLGETQFFSP
jgi:hypothetical protein